MKKLLAILLITFLVSCSHKNYVWMQRKVELTSYGAVPVGDWHPLDTTHAQPIYQLKKFPVKQIAGYGQ